MSLYCANCDTEAVVRLSITAPGKKRPEKLPLCATCHTAFEWGMTNAEQHNQIEEVEV